MAKTTKPAADAKTIEAKPAPIKVLVEAPALRGSRAARWPIIVAAANADALRQSLTEAGFNYAGTVRWATRAGLIKMG